MFFRHRNFKHIKESIPRRSNIKAERLHNFVGYNSIFIVGPDSNKRKKDKKRMNGQMGLIFKSKSKNFGIFFS